MSAIAKFGERNSGNTGWSVVYDIPYIYQLDISRDLIGERDRTAGGLLRQDVITIKRRWVLVTRRMTRDEAYGLLNYLSYNFYGPGDFWLDEFGSEGNTVTAIIPPEQIREHRVTMVRDGVYHNDAKELELTVIER